MKKEPLAELKNLTPNPPSLSAIFPVYTVIDDAVYIVVYYFSVSAVRYVYMYVWRGKGVCCVPLYVGDCILCNSIKKESEKPKGEKRSAID